jgi:thiosulfate/3-mercaptopyruvate sulfurtransferase
MWVIYITKTNLNRVNFIFPKNTHNYGVVLGIIVILMATMMPGANAGCSCSVGNWDPTAFLNDDVPGVPSSQGNANTVGATSTAVESAQSIPEPEYRSDLFTNGQVMKPLESMSSSDVVIDASNGNGYGQSHIKGAIHVPSRSFIDDKGSIKPAQELASILGEAGVSRDDPIVVYSDDFGSGDATLVFWALKYLGQSDVKVLDGSLEDWSAANLPVESSENTRPAVTYNPNLKSDTLASYDYVKDSDAQIIDARSFAEFGKGRIPGAISLDPAKVLVNGKIKDESQLAGVFSSLSKDKPVVVYSGDHKQASVVGYALQLLGYNTEIYTWPDWAAHEPASESSKAAATEGKSPSGYMKLGSMG